MCTRAYYVPADDLTDPAPVVLFGHLDAITVLIFTRIQGRYVSLNDTILGFSQIVTGSLDIWSEGGFYLKGTICDITNC